MKQKRGFYLMETKLLDAMIEHMNAEFESYYLYLSMAAYFEKNSWDGFSSWMHHQADEEREHAMKFYNYLLQVGEFPKLLTINGPADNWESPLQVFEEALEHEKKITSLISDLLDLAIELKDRGTENMLRWFIDEQIEEEATVGGIVDRIRRVTQDGRGLMFIDNELGERDNTQL